MLLILSLLYNLILFPITFDLKIKQLINHISVPVSIGIEKAMQDVKSYVKENKKQLKEIFKSMGSNATIQATRVYQFLQSAFDTQEFKFITNGKSFFSVEQNADRIEILMQEYYLKKNVGETKFYMYRVEFTFAEVIDIIRYWLQRDESVSVYYKGSGDNIKEVLPLPNDKVVQLIASKQQQQNKKAEEKSQHSDNQFMPEESSIPDTIASYKEQMRKYQQRIKTKSLNQQEIKVIKAKIKQLSTKILFLQQRLSERSVSKFTSLTVKSKSEDQNQYQKSNKNKNKKSISAFSKNGDEISSKRKRISPQKIQSTLKAIFQFYAKQLHVTGIKASFQRIEHESTTINYQKLVHFLKEYHIFPTQSKDQKKLHHIYVKSSSKTRDLTYQGFLTLLEKLAEIIIPAQTSAVDVSNSNFSNFELLKYKIIEQRKKNKILNNPFHSLQKEDFRIDKATLKYQFKLIPLNGKDPEQINSQLQNRRLIKQQKKSQRQNIQLRKKIRYIKKLQSIDPFHPLVEKNKHLIRQRSASESQAVVSMNNLQVFRDKSFDLKMLGIEQSDNEDQTAASNSNTRRKSLASNGRNSVRNRADQVQKLEVQKMKSLMSKIIEKSNAKLQKLGLSPTKRGSKDMH